MKKLGLLFWILLTYVGVSAQNPGDLDESFGNNGIVKTAISESFDEPCSILTQPDGKIITVGRARMDAQNYSIYISRHLSDGELDDTFGINGIRVWRPVDVYGNFAMAAQLLEDGKIVISGYFFDGDNSQAFVLRINNDGSDDVTFGANGMLMLSNNTHDVVEAMQVQSDGKIVLGGYRTEDRDRMLVFRVLPDGQFDDTFGNNGVSVLSLPEANESFVFDLRVQNDGKIVLFGTSILEGVSYISTVVRLNSDGSLDNSFGNDGVVYLSVGEAINFLQSGCLRPDGRIFVGGHYWISNFPVLHYGFYVASFNPDGTLDTSFGSDGGVVKLIVDKDAGNYFVDMRLSEDEKLFCLGFSTDNSYGDFVVFNFTMDGNLNLDFSDDGVAVLELSSSIDNPKCVELQSDGKLLACGQTIASGVYDKSDIIIARYHTGVVTVLQEQEAKCEVFVYPNPTAGQLKIDLSNNKGASYKAMIFDMTGRVVMTEQINAQGTIDVSKLQAGSYFIQLVSDQEETLVNRFEKE